MNRHHTYCRLLPRSLLAVALLAASQNVLAYLDPSTGSMVVSAIVGILASIALAVKTYWYKFKGWFRRKDEQPDDSARREE
jgi:hypothetical protein